MKISKKGLDFIAKYEGFYARAYDDLQPKVVLTANTKIKGTLTIGYGTTKYANGSKVKWSDTITKEKALALFEAQVEQHCATFKKALKVEISQTQYDMLASFSYNCGAAAITNNKTFINAINSKNWTAAMNQLKLYNKSKGIVLAGLTRRRNEEAANFLANLPTGSAQKPSNTLKSTALVAQEVIDNKWGAGDARKNALTKAGYNYAVIQAEVNKLLAKPKLKPIAVIAKEVYEGKWGNGDARKNALKKAGYDPAAVQKEVNKLAAKNK